MNGTRVGPKIIIIILFLGIRHLLVYHIFLSIKNDFFLGKVAHLYIILVVSCVEHI